MHVARRRSRDSYIISITGSHAVVFDYLLSRGQRAINSFVCWLYSGTNLTHSLTSHPTPLQLPLAQNEIRIIFVGAS